MFNGRWRTFIEARAFVRELGLLDVAEWFSYCRGELETFLGRKPADIPVGASEVYRGAGWSGWRDWLGSPPIDPVEPGYRTFKRARAFARSLELRSPRAWRAWCQGRGPIGLRRRPADVPTDPTRMYPRAWRGWADWLGAHGGAPKGGSRGYLPFERARAWARTLRLRSAREWSEVCRGRHADHDGLIPGVPATPALIYRHCGWNGFGDWLGTGNRGPGDDLFVTFDEAQEFVRGLGFTSSPMYFAWSKGERRDLPRRPQTIPADPDHVYAGRGWTTWGEFLGTGNIHPTKRTFRPFEAAREFARALGLRNSGDWHAIASGAPLGQGEIPIDVPHNPDLTYAGKGWAGWGAFLGTGNIAPTERVFRPFREIREFARSLGLRTGDEWAVFARGELPGREPLPPDIPRAPQNVFRGRGWKGWGDFRGTGRVANEDRAWRRFAEARKIARGLGLRTRAEWSAYVLGTLPGHRGVHTDLPCSPSRIYAGKGWRGWCDFLGVPRRGRPTRGWRSFEEARGFARGLGFTSSRAWEEWTRGDRPDLAPRPADIPAVPYVAYAMAGWRGWRDFLGTESP